MRLIRVTRFSLECVSCLRLEVIRICGGPLLGFFGHECCFRHTVRYSATPPILSHNYTVSNSHYEYKRFACDLLFGSRTPFECHKNFGRVIFSLFLFER